jgi:rhamnose transport system ATP-binding protein
VTGLAFRDVAKSFGAVQALTGVSFEVAEGEIHALVGENGAGKSTLLKVLAGIVRPDRGSLSWAGETLRFGSPREALERGIGMVYQEKLAFPNLTVAANIFAGRELTRGFGRLDEPAMRRRTAELLAELHVPATPDTPMEQLPTALSQLVQVARALAFDCKVLVLDEPTTSLTDVEVDHLFREVRAHAGTFVTAETTPDVIVRAMVGREPPARVGRGVAAGVEHPVRLSVTGLSQPPQFSDISFEARGGEVVAIFGLVGSGRSELLEAIFGISPAVRGHVAINGRRARIRSARQAARAGLALVPEDRQRQGLLFNLSQRDNIALPSAEKSGRASVNAAAEQAAADRERQALNLKTASLALTPDALSGGNQQKVVVAKWLATHPDVLLLDEPTKGVDVGAKFELHAIIRRQVDAGMACVMVSSDLGEVLALADRILVMREGRITGELDGPTATDEAVMQLATHEATA